jgi:folate-binding protein YgfZ
MADFMNTWLQFLTEHGARIEETSSDVLGFEGMNTEITPMTDFVTPLSDLGMIACAGEDAVRFLHSQLTNDVEHLDAHQVRLAGYCSPKGRLLATFLMWKASDNIILQLPREIQPAIQKRLQMFVLRAKVKMTDLGATHVALGLAGAKATDALANWFPDLPSAPYTKVETESGTLLRVADAQGAPRYQWITSQAVAENAWPKLIEKLTPAATQVWRLSEIYAGVPRITQATQEQFVPQMVNFELIGGVNFKKGCYPGQEIVARSQYLGKLKRRMMLATLTDSQSAAGMEIFSVADGEQPCGMIVNTESVNNNEMACLVEIKLASLDTSVHLGSLNGPALQFKSLPYAFPNEESA